MRCPYRVKYFACFSLEILLFRVEATWSPAAAACL
jgi:hypothetical protein